MAEALYRWETTRAALIDFYIGRTNRTRVHMARRGNELTLCGRSRFVLSSLHLAVDQNTVVDLTAEVGQHPNSLKPCKLCKRVFGLADINLEGKQSH